MKPFLKSAFVLFLVFVLGVGTVFADENPIDFKQSKNAWVVWMEYQNGENQILASQWQADRWATPSVVSSSGENIAPAIALDSEGNPWVVWSRDNGAGDTIYLSRFDGKEWSAEQELSTENGRENVTPAIAMNAEGKAVVAWGSVLNSSSHICVREWNGEKWGEMQTLTDEDERPDMVPAVSFDAKGNAVVAWASADASFSPRLATAWNVEGKWAREQELEIGDVEFGQDLPALKLEGETLALYYEDGNRVFASQWNGKNWTSKKLADFSNEFYSIFKNLQGNPQGRAWFAWINNKGRSNSFRYNIVTHDASLADTQSQPFHYFSNYLDKGLEKAVSFFAWVLGEEEAYAKGKKKKSKGPTKRPKRAVGDSITAGSPGSSWAAFWPADVTKAKPGARVTSGVFFSLARALPDGDGVSATLGGTNDVGDGRSSGDIVAALVHTADITRGKGMTAYLLNGVARADGHRSGVEALASAINANGSVAVIETLRATDDPANRIDGVGHLSEGGAMKVGKIVAGRAR